MPFIMILVDTSVLVDYLRLPSDRVLHLFEENEAAICGVIRAEMPAGAPPFCLAGIGPPGYNIKGI